MKHNSKHYVFLSSLVCAMSMLCAHAAIFGTLRGVVHDPSGKPVSGAGVKVRSTTSDFNQQVATSASGEFELSALPMGRYRVEVEHPGFLRLDREVTVVSGSAPSLNLGLKLGSLNESVTVREQAEALEAKSSTTLTLVSRQQVEQTPGAELSNSLAMITDYVPGAYVTHDQLHVRGGHQVTWAVDGIPIPNTNIASNVGPQIDPKDIDYLEAQRGGYSSEFGDRTYAVFNVVPRTGFERTREGEIFTTYGSFHQTNDAISLGDHTKRFAYYASVNGNRSDYGLEPPVSRVIHDRAWGMGAFGTLVFNPNAQNQMRVVTSVRRDDYQIPNDADALAAGVRDVERERDGLASFSWIRTLSPGLLVTVSPFYHYNAANYDGDPKDAPISTTQQRTSQYAGAQASINAVTRHHNARAGIYGFAQHDRESVGLVANDGSDLSLEHLSLQQRRAVTGHLEAFYLEDQYRVTSWLSLNGGVRLTHFSGAIDENAVSPRTGAALRIPRLNWVFRATYGRYYQAPPLSTVSGPLLQYAVTQGLGYLPLRGERDEEHQFGVTIPVRGWSVDADQFHLRARNFFDHNPIGNSNVFFPLSISSARVYGSEVAIRSPRIAHRGQFTLAYSHQHAEGAGAVTGGLTHFSPPADGYFQLDHDQRDTLHAGFQIGLPKRAWVGGNLFYGSGFSDGSSDVPAHLPGHTTFDFSVGKNVHENWSVALNALNAGNRRVLLDNSLTFGGTHYLDPRQIYLQVRYRFHY